MVSKIIKHLNPVVFSVTNDNVVVLVDCNSTRTVKETFFKASSTKGPLEHSQLIKDMDFVTGSITDNHIVVVINSYSLGTMDSFRRWALVAKGTKKFSSGSKDVDLGAIRNDIVVETIHCNVLESRILSSQSLDFPKDNLRSSQGSKVDQFGERSETLPDVDGLDLDDLLAVHQRREVDDALKVDGKVGRIDRPLVEGVVVSESSEMVRSLLMVDKDLSI